MKRTLVTLSLALLGTSLFSQGLPKPSQEDRLYVLFGRHANGQSCITEGYDTDKDGTEDTRTHSMLYPTPDGRFAPIIDSYIEDENRDKDFSDEKWKEYSAKESEEIRRVI